MLNDLLLLGYSYFELPKNIQSLYSVENTHISTFNNIQSIIEYLLTCINYSLVEIDGEIKRINNNDNNIEKEIDYSFTIIINSNLEFFKTNLSNCSNLNLNNLDVYKLVKLLKYRFLHLNPIILKLDVLDVDNIENNNNLLINDLRILDGNLSTRLIRIKSWIGFNNEDFETLNTMINYLEKNENNNEDNDNDKDTDVDNDNNSYNDDDDDDHLLFTNLLSNDINYNNLLTNLKFSDVHYLNLLEKWDFNAFQFNLDELVELGFIIFSNYLNKNGDDFKPTNNLKSFLFFIRDNYRIGNPFHNFRHAIDVLQATNYLLNQLVKNLNYKIDKIKSFSLLLSSLGHDIGHPGITNLFLINFRSPLSIKFNNISILENFHKFQFKKILIPFLNQSILNFFDVDEFDNFEILFKIINNSILATDMAKHDEFVKTISNFKFEKDNFQLLSCLIIKCADISNVCRLINPSCKWGLSLNEEFKQINCLENYLKNEKNDENLLNDYLIENNFNKQIKDIDVIEGIKLVENLNKNQMFFIDRFANDFFCKIGESIPELKFLYNQLSENSEFWINVGLNDE